MPAGTAWLAIFKLHKELTSFQSEVYNDTVMLILLFESAFYRNLKFRANSITDNSFGKCILHPPAQSGRNSRADSCQ